MADAVASDLLHHPGATRPKLDQKPSPIAGVAFCGVLALGLGYGLHGLVDDVQNAHETIAFGVFALLGLALLIALGFEFVNGFHDTANAVATVIYTHSMPPVAAVVWSGCWNLIGVITSAGTVAFSIITLLPVELILQVGSGAGYAMIFALLLAAIIWNLGTWAFGIPNSSSHALIGSVMGVGLANQLMAPAGQATSGVDWGQAQNVFQALLFSPLMGFALAAIALLLLKLTVRAPELYQEPKTDAPPPLWIRGLLVLTCTGVSFAHGSNDGQKGMGLIMLILIGAAPTAYALNRTMPTSSTPAFISAGTAAQAVFAAHAKGLPAMPVQVARGHRRRSASGQELDAPTSTPSANALTGGDIGANVKNYGAVSHVPAAATPNMRNDM